MEFEEISLNGKKEKIVVRLDESYNPDVFQNLTEDLDDTIVLKKEDLNE